MIVSNITEEVAKAIVEIDSGISGGDEEQVIKKKANDDNAKVDNAAVKEVAKKGQRRRLETEGQYVRNILQQRKVQQAHFCKVF